MQRIIDWGRGVHNLDISTLSFRILSMSPLYIKAKVVIKFPKDGRSYS